MKLQSSGAEHFVVLDILRTAAITLVLLRHCIRPFLEDSMPGAIIDEKIWMPLANIMKNGWVGVDLFFILSGFLITRSLYLASQRDGSVLRFYKKRSLRILPAYFFVLILICAGIFPLYPLPHEGVWKEFLIHVFFLQDYLGSDLNIVYWSLGVEIKFYLLAPFLILPLWRVFKRSRSLVYAALLSLVLLGPVSRFISLELAGGIPDNYGQSFILFRSPLHSCLDALFTGVLCYYIYHDLPDKVSKRASRFIALIVAFLCCAFLASHDIWRATDNLEIVFQPLFLNICLGAVMIFGLTGWAGMGRLKFVRGTANLSYSVYLIHWPMIPLCLVLPVTMGLGNASEEFVPYVTFCVLLVTLSLTGAWVSYKYI